MHSTYFTKALGIASIVSLSAMATTAGAQSMGMASFADRAFMMKASEANLGEISAGMLAEQRGASAPVRALAKRFVDNHRANQHRLMMLAKNAGVMLPMHPMAADRMGMQKLKMLHGAAFDRAYISMEERGHVKNIDAFKAEAASGSSAAVVAYAKASLPVLEEHLQLATDDAAHLGRMPMGMNGMHSGMSGSNSMGSSNSMGGSSGMNGSGSMGGAGGMTPANGMMSPKPAMPNGPGSPQNPAGQNPNTSPVNGPNGSSPSINTQPATGAGQTSGSGTPTSPNNGNGSVPGSPAGPGR